jgi:hypothetical protein
VLLSFSRYSQELAPVSDLLSFLISFFQMERKACPCDVTNAEGALVATYLILMAEDVPQREYPATLRIVDNLSKSRKIL